MKITVIGAGAIGSLVAAYLTKAGEDVTLIARQEQADLLNKSGLTIKTSTGEENIKVKVLSKMNEEADLVIFTVKTQDVEQAYQQNHKFLDRGHILTSQNGVQADSILGIHFERERMFSSIVMFGSTFVKSGEITYNFPGDWIIGRPTMPVDGETHDIADVLQKAFNVVVTENIMGMKYLKLFVNFNNCIPALIGKSMQETFADMEFCRLSILLLREGFEIVKNAKIELVSLPNYPTNRLDGLVNMPVEEAAGIINRILTTLSEEPLYGSILQSILRGRTSEIDFINGEVVFLGRQMQMDAPLNEKIVDMVHQVELNKKFYSVEEVKKAFNLLVEQR